MELKKIYLRKNNNDIRKKVLDAIKKDIAKYVNINKYFE